MKAISRILEYRRSHGDAYTVKRLGQKAAQLLLGTYGRRRRREQATEEELRAQRERQPDAGLISVVIPVYNTDPRMLEALLDRYMNTDIYEIEKTDVLKLDPFNKFGKPSKIAQLFGGKEGYLKAVRELEEAIYSGVA